MSRLIHSQFLARTSRLHEGVSTSQLGNLSYLYDETTAVTKRRELLARDLGSQLSQGVMFRPLNQDIIADVDSAYRGLGMTGGLPLRADALVTQDPGVGLFLLLADCQGISFYDPEHEVIALAHCSRKSTNLKLAVKTLKHLQQFYATKPENVLVYLGPSIGADHYVFESWIRDELEGWGMNLRSAGNGKYAVDVRGYNLEQLRLAGVRSKNIEDSNIDTYSSTDFYSHVQVGRDGVTEGRFAQYVELRAPSKVKPR
jgi:copper oxidase (laccase) domain-containing protein